MKHTGRICLRNWPRGISMAH